MNETSLDIINDLETLLELIEKKERYTRELQYTLSAQM